MHAGDTVEEAPGPASCSAARAGALRRLLLKRLWLPRTLYAAIPWIYLAAGAACLAGGLFLPEAAWLYPYLVLLGLALAHGALAIASLRHRPPPRDRTRLAGDDQAR